MEDGAEPEEAAWCRRRILGLQQLHEELTNQAVFTEAANDVLGEANHRLERLVSLHAGLARGANAAALGSSSLPETPFRGAPVPLSADRPGPFGVDLRRQSPSTSSSSSSLPAFPHGVTGQEVALPSAFDESCMTTLLVRNIPARFSRDQLVQIWCVDAPETQYDFLYLPYDASMHRTKGYAFLNCLSAEAARRFWERWHRQHLPGAKNVKALHVGAAKLQGLQANLSYLSRHNGVRIPEAHQPVVLVNGLRVDFLALLECLADDTIDEELSSTAVMSL